MSKGGGALGIKYVSRGGRGGDEKPFPHQLSSFSFYAVHHRGDDGWCLGEATVELRDGTVVTCTANIFLDDTEEFVCGA